MFFLRSADLALVDDPLWESLSTKQYDMDFFIQCGYFMGRFLGMYWQMDGMYSLVNKHNYGKSPLLIGKSPIN
jgi:hypothetical protein